MFKGWKQLTVKERQHISKVAGVHSTYDLEQLFKGQAALRAHGGEPCWDCKSIALKLGYDV